MYQVFMKFGTQNKSNMLIMNIIIGIEDPDPKFQIWFQNWNVLQFFMKSGAWSKSSMLIMNIVLGIDDLDQNYRVGQI